MFSTSKVLLFATILPVFFGLWLVGTAEPHDSEAPAPGKISSAPAQSLKDASAAVDAFHAALARADATAALALLDDSVQIFEQGEVERSRSEYASQHLPSDIEFSRTTQSMQTSRSGAADGDFAYVMSERKTAGRYNNKDIKVIGIETMVLYRKPDGWRIVHVHWSSRKADE